MRLKQLENSGIRVEYYNKMNDVDTIHGKLTYVSKDSIVVMGAIEYVIKRAKIKSFEPINYAKQQTQ